MSRFGIENTATIEGPYRYSLTRDIGLVSSTPILLWIMLNPSTADATVNDQTITKCMGFARRLGFGSLSVVNLFALRSTDPRGLLNHPDPVGPDNDEHIERAMRLGDRIFVAWGSQTGRLGALVAQRAARVFDIINAHGRQPEHLGLAANGAPRHPLMLAYRTRPQDFPLPTPSSAPASSQKGRGA